MVVALGFLAEEDDPNPTPEELAGSAVSQFRFEIFKSFYVLNGLEMVCRFLNNKTAFNLVVISFFYRTKRLCFASCLNYFNRSIYNY